MVLCRFRQLSEGAAEQSEAVQQEEADAGAANAPKPANPLLGIVTSQRDRFRARCAGPTHVTSGVCQEDPAGFPRVGIL